MKKLFNIVILLMLALPAQAAVEDTLALASYEHFRDSTAITTVDRNFAPNYKQKYKTAEFSYDLKESNKKLSKLQEFLRWLADLFSPGGGIEGEGLTGTEIVKRIVAGVIILLVIYFIARALLKKEGYWIFSKSRKSISAKDINIQNIETVDFQSLIKDTLLTDNYRLGLRYYYLWLLKLLAYNNIIKWHQDKTNSDYLYEIKDETLRAQFRYLSYIYDYSWYGEFPVNQADYTKAEKAFMDTINRLKR